MTTSELVALSAVTFTAALEDARCGEPPGAGRRGASAPPCAAPPRIVVERGRRALRPSRAAAAGRELSPSPVCGTSRRRINSSTRRYARSVATMMSELVRSSGMILRDVRVAAWLATPVRRALPGGGAAAAAFTSKISLMRCAISVAVV